MKRVLVVGYSQTGQLHRILDNMTKPIAESGVELVRYNLVPEKKYPFPWSLFNFFDTFPEAVYLDAPPNKCNEVTGEFDLVVLGYQPWFLSPSLPITAFLKSARAKKLLKNCPVVTVIGCRNMWGEAHLQVKGMLKEIGAYLVDNIVLKDQGSNLETFITTPRWLLTGKKQSFLGLSSAGISEEDIVNSVRFGRAIATRLNESDEPVVEPMLTGLGAVKAESSLLQAEKIGKRSFMIWGALLRKLGKQGTWPRKVVLVFYITFLILMIITVVPVSMLVRKVIMLFNPNQRLEVERKFEAPSGSDTSRIQEFL